MTIVHSQKTLTTRAGAQQQKSRHTYRSPKLLLTSANTTKTQTYTDRNNPEYRYKLCKRRKLCYKEYNEEMTDDTNFLTYQSNSKK